MGSKGFKRGRRPVVHNARTMRSAIALDRALAPLGTAPTVSADYVTPLANALKTVAYPPAGGPFGMFLNDQLGDCTIADGCHHIMLTSANGGSIVVPTNAQALKAYEDVSGYQPGNAATDTGADETTVCQYMMATGIAGVKSSGTGMIDATNMNNIRWAMQLFGACRLGIVVNEVMEQDFSNGVPWTQAAAANDTTAGGHDVPVVKYDADYAYVITWGGLQAVSWSLMAQADFLEEAHAEVYADFVTTTGNAPSGFSLAQLLADLPAVEAAA